MQAFSTKCRAHLAHYGCHIAEEIARSTRSERQHTDKSRANHFLKWTASIELQQDPILPHHPLQARNYLIACFAVSLIRGETIKGQSIRHATIRNYANAACKLHTDRGQPSPYGAQHDYISIVLKAVLKYEAVKKRRSMIHDEMVHYMASEAPSYQEDSMESSLLDWIYLGRYAGYRSIEWCQKTQRTYAKIDHPNWKGPKSYAFIADDFQFFDHNKQHIADIESVTIDDILYFDILYRKQKNDQNYEVISYYRDLKNRKFCAVAAALRIRQRAIRLGIPSDEPLAQYNCRSGTHKGKRCYITNTNIATYLRYIASKVYNIKDKKSLSKWSAHSIRVTACNLLHRQGLSDSYIQTRLRWTSKAFLGYLRNTLYSAAAHTQALHIPDNNLPTLSAVYTSVTLPAGNVGVRNSTSAAPLQRYRQREEIEQVLHAGAA